MTRTALLLFVAVGSTLLLSFGERAHAQVRPPLTSSSAFPVSVVSPDSALSLDLNPAGLATLDTWSLVVSHVEPLERSVQPDRATLGAVGFDIADTLALGAGFDVVQHERPGVPSTRAFLIGAALHPAPWASVGLTWRVRGSELGEPTLHSADAALTLWPAPFLGLVAMGRDLSIQPLRLGPAQVQRSAVAGVLVRPLLDDRLWLELAGVHATRGELGVRLAGSIPIPGIGRLAVSGEREEQQGRDRWTLTVGLDFRAGPLSVAPAAARAHGDLGWSLLAEVHGHPRAGLPQPGYIARLELSELGSRGLLSRLLDLEQALLDGDVEGVALLPRGGGLSLSAAQEMRLMIATLQRAGKRVSCHLETPSGAEYYMCAAADRVTLDEAGYLRLMGLSADSLYLGELLSDVGVRADFVRIGDYKSAPEQLTNRESSGPAREQREDLLDDGYARLVADLAKDLGRPAGEVEGLIDRGPFTAEEALTGGLVHATLDEHDLGKDLEPLFGGGGLKSLGRRAHAERFGPTGQVGVVVVDGNIVDGENVDIPLFDTHMSGGRTISQALDEMADDPRIRAIVLRVDSPGGAVTASDQIWRAVKRARAKKPVIASMGSVAASGGYYVAAAADEIWASPSTITGSIGVFYGKVDIAPLVERYGVHIESDKRGAHAGADSVFRPFTDEERAALADKLRIWYRNFIARVAEGRKMRPEEVDAVARGHVYSGDRAQRVGLVDELGGFSAALARARQLGHLAADSGVVIVPERPSSLLDYVREEGDLKTALGLLPPSVRALLSRAALLSRLGATQPVALYEGPLGP